MCPIFVSALPVGEITEFHHKQVSNIFFFRCILYKEQIIIPHSVLKLLDICCFMSREWGMIISFQPLSFEKAEIACKQVNWVTLFHAFTDFVNWCFLKLQTLIGSGIIPNFPLPLTPSLVSVHGPLTINYQ